MRHLILILLLLMAAPALRAQIYECVDANGKERLTNINSGAKGCKLLDIYLPGTARNAQPEENARDDSDPRARLQAIEDWARGTRDTFDPVTHALVDPNESVRARAQVLWEEALKRP